jgi:N-ethylmaleimide reductase
MVEVVEAMTGAWDRERVGVKLSPSNRFYGMFDADARETFGYVISALDAMRVGYLHLMEPNANDMRSGTVQLERVAEAFRPLISVPVVTNGGYDRNKAEAALAAGLADLVSFGVPFVANPDLPARLQTRAPLNIPDPDTFYGEGPKGYTDYPALEPHATLLQRSPA